jgi:hypothetical protein
MNCNAEGRDVYLGIDSTKGGGGVVHFDAMTYEQAQHCLDKGWMDPEYTQNDSPTNAEMVEFVKKNPAFVLHGYVVSTKRDDVRISIEGVRAAKKTTAKQRGAFVDMFRCADEFQLDPPRAWYD